MGAVDCVKVSASNADLRSHQPSQWYYGVTWGSTPFFAPVLLATAEEPKC